MSDQYRARAKLQAESVRLEKLEAALLEHLRLDEAPRPTRLREGDLSIYVNDLAVGQRPMLEGELVLRIHVPDEAVVAWYDVRAVEQILMNLLDNAAKHAAGGTSPEIEVEVRVEADAAILLVADRGPGMPAAERERTFEGDRGARRRKEGASGFGRGLPIVRDRARSMGGGAKLEPREGGGTVARVSIPRAHPSEP